jgi:polyhydroxyalkanoate synthesis regulator phasin
MDEQGRQILVMLAEGKITADEAERLINALERQQAEPAAGAESRPKARPKYLRVLVEDTSGGDEPSRVNIRVPLQLLRAGVRLTSLVPPKALARANEELGKHGVPIDLAELKPQQLEELIDQLHEITVDIDDPVSKVRVFAE